MSFDVAEIIVTHSYHYDPSEYLQFCEDNDEEPSESGFIKYIRDEIDKDFPGSAWHPLRIVSKSRPESVTSDDSALDAVAALLNAEQWSSDHLNAVADIVRATGRTINDV